MIGGKLMDWAKIVGDLKARALSTTYEGERKLCLKKIDEILLKYKKVKVKQIATKSWGQVEIQIIMIILIIIINNFARGSSE